MSAGEAEGRDLKQPELSPNVFKYHVMQGDEIVGTFGNAKLAYAAARSS
jgi:hypothetical protein